MDIRINEKEAVQILRQLEDMPYKMVFNLIGFFEAKLQEAKNAEKESKAEEREKLKKGGKKEEA